MAAQRLSRFKFVAGHPVLDLTNTVGRRLRDPPEERLRSYQDLLRWSRQAGLLDGRTVTSLGRRARRSPAEAERVLAWAIRFREAAYGLCVALLRRERPSRSDVQTLDRLARRARTHAGLRWSRGGLRREWPRSGLDAMLPPLVDACVELLTSERSRRIGRCRGPECGWLFVDGSRAGARQWCSMAVCGNRAKARRHLQRKRPS